MMSLFSVKITASFDSMLHTLAQCVLNSKNYMGPQKLFFPPTRNVTQSAVIS